MNGWHNVRGFHSWQIFPGCVGNVMQRRNALLLVFGFTLLVLVPASLAAVRPIEVEDLFRLKRVSEPQVSPDGQQIAYVVTEVLKAENRTQSDIWVMPATGGNPRQLTNSPRQDRHPRWSPDGKWIAFESNRAGDYQIWIMPAKGGKARKLTTLATEATQPVWAPTGDKLAFVSAVFPEFSNQSFAQSDSLNKEKLAAREKSQVKARVITQLLYRHWDSWVDDRRQHLFVIDVKNGKVTGGPRDVTPGENDAVPTSSTFSEGDEFDFSPDGRELAFAAPHHVTREQAWTTNHDLWIVDLASGVRRQITTSPAADTHPRYSPDGKFLAYHAQARAGFEADRWQLCVRDLSTGDDRSLTVDFDSSVEAFEWERDGKGLLFAAENKGVKSLFAIAVDGGVVRQVAAGGMINEFSVSGGSSQIFFTLSRFTLPTEIFGLDRATGVIRHLTVTNADLLAKIELPQPESVTVSGAGGTPVQMWILKPPGFDPAKKYPLVFWVHGGPQGSFLDSWSTRWNPEVWAAPGYVIALPNPRGSTGFGQQFTDEISRDWGGKVYDDLLACVAYLEKQPYIDATKMAAAGASYGGYMMNWFQGHTDKFKTLITHCGVYDNVAMYGTTEETWFDEWEHGIPWENPEAEKFSPNKFAANFKTPNLIIHNELDFRVPLGQGLSLFTTLQRKGIPSKLLYFPDEGHWVLKPQNSELWHQTIFDWLAVYLK